MKLEVWKTRRKKKKIFFFNREGERKIDFIFSFFFLDFVTKV